MGFLYLHLINSEIELDLSCLRNCTILEISKTARIAGVVAAASATSGAFQINSTKLYVPVVPLSINNNIKF